MVDSRRIEQDGSFDVVITWGLLDLVERISHLTSPTIDERSVPGTDLVHAWLGSRTFFGSHRATEPRRKKGFITQR